MFAVLEHTLADGVHWDFLVAAPGAERLATWRLSASPLKACGSIAAERIADHRREYLEFEGDIRGGRGGVRRLDRGEAQALHWSDTLVMLQLGGRFLEGTVALRLVSGASWTFEFRRGVAAAEETPS